MCGICFFFLGLLLLIIQTTLFPTLPAWVGKPDLLFILLIFVALRMKIFSGGVLTLFFGLLMDVFSGIFLGLCPLIYLLVFVSIQWLSRHLVIREVTHQLPLVVVAYLFMSSGIYIGSSIFADKGGMMWSWSDVLLQMVMLAIMTMPLFYLFDRIKGFFDRRGMRWTLVGSRPKNRFAAPGPGERR